MGLQRVGHNWVTFTFTWASLVAQLMKNLPAVQQTRFDPLVRKFPGEGNGNPLQYSCLENPMDKGAGKAAAHGITKSDTTVQLTHFFFQLTYWVSIELYIHEEVWYKAAWATGLREKSREKSPQIEVPKVPKRVCMYCSHDLVAQACPALCQAPRSMEFSRQEYWSRLPFPSFKGSSQCRDRAQVSCTAGGFFTVWTTSEAQSS